jgi:uncharacterized protein YndB with AHSA1/START domain
LLQTKSVFILQARLHTLKLAAMPIQNLVITHHFAAPVERVWQAFTDADLVRQWWGPDYFTCPSAELYVAVGQSSLLCMRAPQKFGGGDSYSKLTYTEVVPHKRLGYTHNLANASGQAIKPEEIGMPADFPQNMPHLIEFIAQPDGSTEVIVTEYGWPVGQMMEMSRMGMEQCLHKMAAVL